MYYLGGHTITGAGWVGPQAVYVDFVSVETGCVWQLYANRLLIGASRIPGERRVIGHLTPSLSPAPLTLVRVDKASQFTDYGPELPLEYFNRFEMLWSTSGSAHIDHFDIVGGRTPGGAVDTTNILGKVNFAGDGNYKWQLDPFSAGGTWNFGVLPRDAAGNAGTLVQSALVVAMPPADVKPNIKGNRFTLAAEAGTVTATFHYQ